VSVVAHLIKLIPDMGESLQGVLCGDGILGRESEGPDLID